MYTKGTVQPASRCPSKLLQLQVALLYGTDGSNPLFPMIVSSFPSRICFLDFDPKGATVEVIDVVPKGAWVFTYADVPWWDTAT